MFRIITNLLFGEEDKPTEDISSTEADDEEWHVVSHQDAVADEHQEGALLDQNPTSSVQSAPLEQQDAVISGSSTETLDQKKNSAFEAVHGILCQAKDVTQASLSACVQKEKTFAQRHSTSRNAIHRLNRTRQGAQHQVFHLHQPSQRNLCH